MYIDSIQNEFKTTRVGEDTDPQAHTFDEIKLTPKLFGNWSPQGVPEQHVKDELAKAISQEMMYDVEVFRDKMTNEVKMKASTTIYMKPSNIEMNDTISRLNGQLRKEKETNRGIIVDLENVTNLLKDSEKSNEKALYNWLKYSELYYIKLGNDNNWRYLIKRGVKLWWLNVKINVMEFSRFLPRG